VITRAAVHGDERTLIKNAYSWLNERTPDGLATYKGASFDFTFLNDRMEALEIGERPSIRCAEKHVDLYPARKRIADQSGRKWPSLEESLDAYDLPIYSTQWEGAELTNNRFGEDLAPRYLTALAREDDSTLNELESTVIEYTASDVEANIALYEADAGRTYIPKYSY
jgi:DNA polymerase elongation subunit (family B)